MVSTQPLFYVVTSSWILQRRNGVTILCRSTIIDIPVGTSLLLAEHHLVPEEWFAEADDRDLSFSRAGKIIGPFNRSLPESTLLLIGNVATEDRQVDVIKLGFDKNNCCTGTILHSSLKKGVDVSTLFCSCHLGICTGTSIEYLSLFNGAQPTEC